MVTNIYRRREKKKKGETGKITKGIRKKPGTIHNRTSATPESLYYTSKVCKIGSREVTEKNKRRGVIKLGGNGKKRLRNG